MQNTMVMAGGQKRPMGKLMNNEDLEGKKI